MFDIDYKNLVKQDEDFAEYIKEVTWSMLFADPAFAATIKMMYVFYQQDLTIEQAVAIMRQSSKPL